MGLGAVWLAAPVMAKKEIEKILKVPGVSILYALSQSDMLMSSLKWAEDPSMRF